MRRGRNEEGGGESGRVEKGPSEVNRGLVRAAREERKGHIRGGTPVLVGKILYLDLNGTETNCREG